MQNKNKTNFTSPKTTVLRAMMSAVTDQPPLTAEDLSNRRKFATIVITCFATMVLCIFAVTTFNHFRALRELKTQNKRDHDGTILEHSNSTKILVGKTDYNE